MRKWKKSKQCAFNAYNDGEWEKKITTKNHRSECAICQKL